MSMHPSLRRSAPRPSNTDSSPSPIIKQEQVEYKVHEPPPPPPLLPSTSSSSQSPILYSRHHQLPASTTHHTHPLSSLSSSSSSKLPNVKSLSHSHSNSNGHPNTTQSQSIRALVQSQPDEFIKNIFPNDETQSHFRESLRRDVICTSWWLHNLMEPSRDLCAFIPRMNDNQFHCTSCGKKFTRVDRAVDHFRVHIDHRPYQCSGEDGCGFANCKLGFFTKDCLKAHCARTEVTCDRCGTTVEDKNLARHQNTRKCRRV